jgi:hypothetical protein
MRYRGVEYSIRVGITRGEWRVVVSLADNVTIERTVMGSRQKAEDVALKMIANLGEPKQRAG